MKPKIKKPLPHAFVIEAIFPLDPVTKSMFGCTAVYIGEKIMLALREKPESPADNGVWLATTEDHHASLRLEFPSMRTIQIFGKPISGWQNLPLDAPDFGQSALRACALIVRRDPRIGKIPKPRRVRPPVR